MAIVVASFIGLALVGWLVASLTDDKEPRAERSPANTAPTYRLTTTDDADPTETAPEGAHFELSTTLTIDASDVPRGRRAEISVGNVTARFNGEEVDVAIAETQILRLDEQNRPDAVILVAADASGTFFYFVDQLFPVTSSEPVSEGDSWPVAFEASVPSTASGGARYEGTGEFVGHEDVAGIHAEEIRNDLSFEYDFTMLAPEVAELSGLGSISSGTVRVTGTGTMSVTGWIDPSTGQTLRTEVQGSYDVEFLYRDFPAEVDMGETAIPTTGAFVTSLELVP